VKSTLENNGGVFNEYYCEELFFCNNEKNNEGVIQEKNSEISGANAKCDEKHVINSS
jgi:hypothetical protein